MAEDPAEDRPLTTGEALQKRLAEIAKKAEEKRRRGEGPYRYRGHEHPEPPDQRLPYRDE